MAVLIVVGRPVADVRTKEWCCINEWNFPVTSPCQIRQLAHPSGH